MTDPDFVSRQRFIPVAAEEIFDVLAVPAMHSVIDGSGTVQAAQPGGPERLSLGARFGMEMNMAVDYKILNTVVEFEEGRRIAWQHVGRHIWRYTLEPADGGTLVTEEWDARGSGFRLPMRLLRYKCRNAVGIERTLANLDAHLTAGA
ncbi:SRPBCC family protein [Arthrobacter sp. 35W]|uniref:SRPBCC family protein n=1 Tax=Arthrobacter sp. 35W TaxID=1132441 RepID=UPI0003FF297F|nr:SRPBCC family protein [Arthrobacter sp. 35W]